MNNGTLLARVWFKAERIGMAIKPVYSCDRADGQWSEG